MVTGGANTESWLFCRCQKACNRTADELVTWIKKGYDGSSRPNKTGKNNFVYSLIIHSFNSIIICILVLLLLIFGVFFFAIVKLL